MSPIRLPACAKGGLPSYGCPFAGTERKEDGIHVGTSGALYPTMLLLAKTSVLIDKKTTAAYERHTIAKSTRSE
jgi:hypothetical protein